MRKLSESKARMPDQEKDGDNLRPTIIIARGRSNARRTSKPAITRGGWTFIVVGDVVLVVVMSRNSR